MFVRVALSLLEPHLGNSGESIAIANPSCNRRAQRKKKKENVSLDDSGSTTIAATRAYTYMCVFVNICVYMVQEKKRDQSNNQGWSKERVGYEDRIKILKLLKNLTEVWAALEIHGELIEFPL